MLPPNMLNSLKGKTVLVIGDVMLDEYFKGAITRISPEAPVPVVAIKSHSFSLGGAANVAHNISSLGGKATLIWVLGKDQNSQMLLTLLKKAGVNFRYIADQSRPTTTKTRIIAHDQQLLRYDHESTQKISKQLESKILKAAKPLIRKSDAIIISDYNKGVITPTISRELINSANSAGKPVCIDSKNYLAYDMKNATLLKPNLRELSKETKVPITDQSSLEKAAKIMLGKLHPKALLVTKGENGMSLFLAQKKYEIPGIPTQESDVSGAGDTVIAAATLALAAKHSLPDAARLANYAAAIVVRKAGTAVPTINELKALLKSAK